MNSHESIVKQKVCDEQLRKNLSSAMHTLQKNRQNLTKNRFNEWENLRNKGKDVKNYALSNLKTLLEKFEKNATNNGFIIHWADTKEEACKIIYEIMREKNIDKILKGKSMASEEIHLNSYLKERGLTATETDLGEFISQLINEPPVHIVVPAIHKNRYEVGEIFHKHIGAPKESEPRKLNEIARNHMRNEFKSLKMGLGGVNFAIADEGAIMMIENEGNGRMCTTIPDITINICGIEKVVESFEDVATLDTLLVPSATGQFIVNYNNIISGPRRLGEKDGPKECHIVMLNNNRTSMVCSDEYFESLRCIRCGSCMNFCPVYDKIGGHSYRSVYPGPIGEVITPQIFGMSKNADMLTLCSLCGRCSEVCPVKIPLADTIRKLRRDKVGEGKNLATKGANFSRLESMTFHAYTGVLTNGFAFRSAINSARFGNGIIKKFGTQIPVIKKWLQFKEFGDFSYDLHKNIKQISGVIYE